MSGFYAIWPCFAIVAAILCLVATPLFRAADSIPGGNRDRLVSLDGLRGFLALGVVFHHVAIYHRFLLDGVWTLPPSGFYTMTGQTGVSLFFMITGFLFWSRMIAKGGMPHWRRFFIGRLFRIGPLYLVAASVLMLTVLVRNGWTVQVPPGQFATELARLAALGALPQISFDGDPVATLILAGVTWSLEFEWAFYVFLLPAAVFARHAATHLPLALGLAGIGLMRLSIPGAPFSLWAIAAALFGAGMTSASLAAHGSRAVLSDWQRSWIVLALLAGLTSFDTAFAVLPVLLTACVFHLLAGGCTLFGLLRSRPARRLGDISYGIYLLQGPVLLAGYGTLHRFALGGPAGHWIVAFGAVVSLVTIATATHVAVEQPGIRLGRRLMPGSPRPAARTTPAHAQTQGERG